MRCFLVSTLTFLCIGCGGGDSSAPQPAPSRLAFTGQPTTAAMGAQITPAIQVAIRDQSGDLVSGSTASVTIAVSSGSGTAGAVLSGTLTRAAVGGVATFSDLRLDKAGVGYALAATSPGLTSATSNLFAITSPPPTNLFVTQQPTSVTVGSLMLPGVSVAVRDASGAVVTSSSAAITLAVTIGTGTAGAVLRGTVTRNAVLGVAAFTDLIVDKPGVGYTVTATATGLLPATTNTFNVAATAPSNTWSPMTSMLTPRTDLGVGVVNGVLYAVGGQVTAPRTNIVEAYDLVTYGWTTKAPMPTPRIAMAVAAATGILYAVGGNSGTTSTGAVEAYDPVANSWTTKAPMPTARQSLGIGVVNGVLFAVGGHNGTGVLGTLEAYDPATNAWTTKAPMPTPRTSLAVGVINGILYAVGGVQGFTAFTNVEAYDPATNTWTAKTPMPTARGGLGVAVVGGLLYAVGGNTPLTAVLEAYDPVTDSWATKAPMPAPRDYMGAAALNGNLYTVGGSARDAGGTLTTNGAVQAYQP